MPQLFSLYKTIDITFFKMSLPNQMWNIIFQSLGSLTDCASFEATCALFCERSSDNIHHWLLLLIDRKSPIRICTPSHLVQSVDLIKLLALHTKTEIKLCVNRCNDFNTKVLDKMVYTGEHDKMFYKVFFGELMWCLHGCRETNIVMVDESSSYTKYSSHVNVVGNFIQLLRIDIRIFINTIFKYPHMVGPYFCFRKMNDIYEFFILCIPKSTYEEGEGKYNLDQYQPDGLLSKLSDEEFTDTFGYGVSTCSIVEYIYAIRHHTLVTCRKDDYSHRIRRHVKTDDISLREIYSHCNDAGLFNTISKEFLKSSPSMVQ